MNQIEKYLNLSRKKWHHKYTWQPLIISLALIAIIAIVHRSYWESTTETDPRKIWDYKIITKDEYNWTIFFEEEAGESITFKGILRTSPKFEVYRNDTFVPGMYSENEAIVYSEDLYGKTMLNVSGLRVLVNGDLTNEFFVSEIITIKATLVTNISTCSADIPGASV